MASGGYTHGQLATKLVVDGCLAHIAGNVQGQMPIEGIPLTELERADINLAQGGHTAFYPLPPTGVFLDIHGPVSTVWFMGEDGDRTLDGLEQAMKRSFQNVKKTGDDSLGQGKKRREYQIDFGNSRLAVVTVDYPERGAKGERFSVRIVAQARLS